MDDPAHRDSPDEVVARNLRRLRNDHRPKLSQQDLAKRMSSIDGGSSDRSRVAKIERGLVSVTWRDVLTAAIALDVSVRQIVVPEPGRHMELGKASKSIEYFDGLEISDTYAVDSEGAWDLIASPSSEWKEINEQLARTRAEMIATVQALRDQVEEMRATRIVPTAEDQGVEVPPPPAETIHIATDELEDPEDGIDS